MRLRGIAKNLLFAAYLYCGYVQVRDLLLRLRGRSRAVVLCYHRVGGCDVLTRPAGEFRRDLYELRRRFECVSLAELCNRLRSGEPLRRPLVAVTFDDGYRDNYVEAAPALIAAGVPATFFVSTGFVSTSRVFAHDAAHGDTPEESRHPKITWRDLRALQDAGFEIGSHTVDHVNLGRADPPTIEREVRYSLAMLDHHLGARPRAFAFPWGKPGDISDRAVAAIRDAGYYAAAFAFGGDNRPGRSPYAIHRIDAGNGRMGRLALRARLAGFDPARIRAALRRLRHIVPGGVRNSR